MRTRPSRTSLPHLAHPHVRRADRLHRTLTSWARQCPRKCSPCSRRLEEGSTDPAGAVSSPSFCLSGKCRSLVRARLESLTWLLSGKTQGQTYDGHHTQEPRPRDPCVEVPATPVPRLHRVSVLLKLMAFLPVVSSSSALGTSVRTPLPSSLLQRLCSSSGTPCSERKLSS